MPAPGMSEAMAILTSRIASMDGSMTVDEYVNILREEIAGKDPVIITSAVASLAAALVAVAAAATNKGHYELLQTMGSSLNSED